MRYTQGMSADNYMDLYAKEKEHEKKHCTGCGLLKDFIDFDEDSRYRHARHYLCKPCRRPKQRAAYDRYHEKVIQARKEKANGPTSQI